jgi:hypothetical protein
MGSGVPVADHRGMLTCSLCDRTVTVCASCHGTCANPVCHPCGDADPSASHGGTGLTVTLPLSSPVVLI